MRESWKPARAQARRRLSVDWPVNSKMASFGRIRGLACGAFGEGSPDLHKLAAEIAEMGAAKNYQDMGAQTTKQAKARAYRYVYKTLGVEMMRSAAMLRVNRLGTVLAKTETLRAAAARRSNPVPAWFNTRQEYFDRHSFSTSAHDRPW